MEKQKKVLDASVIVKWFSKEEGSEKVVRLVEKHRKGEILIIVPELLFIETLNSLQYKKMNKDSLREVNKTLWNAQFDIQRINEFLLERALEISVRENLTVYDAIYIALAQINGCELITTDKELYKIPNVVPLEKV